jgi:hypothetical protein
MSLESELYQVFQKSAKVAKKPKIVKAPVPVTVPASAKIVFTYYDPRSEGSVSPTLQVRATKARWYVWRRVEWGATTEQEARQLIAHAQAEHERHMAEAAKLYRVQDFVNRCRAVRFKNQAKAERDALLDSVEEAALRMTLKARTLDERIKISDEKEKLEEEIYYAYACAEYDYEEFEGLSDIHDAIEFPELPDAWRIAAANPNQSQYTLKL